MSTYLWTNATRDNNFNTAGNWSPGGGPPGATDIAQFGALNSNVVGNASVGQIQALSATSIQFTGTLDALGLVGMADGVQIGGNAQVGFTTGSSLTVATRLDVGLDGGRSTLSFQGAALHTQTTTTIGSTVGAEGLIGLSQTVWQADQSIVIGQSGAGDLSVGQGAHLSVGTSAHRAAGKLMLGMRPGATGVLSISDGGVVTTTSDVLLGGKPGATTHGTGLITIAGGGNLNVNGTIALSAGSAISLADGYLNGFELDLAAGSVLSGSGSAGATTTVHNAGLIEAYGNLALGSAVDGTGTLAIAAGATLTLLGPVFAQSALSFAGPAATLSLDQFPTVLAPLTNFTAGDIIRAAYADHVAFNSTTDILTLYSGSSTDGQLTLTGNYAGATFHDSYQGSEGIITVTLPPHG